MIAPACDHCDEGVPRVDGWHVVVDPEGLEGDQRIPCPRTEAGVRGMYARLRAEYEKRPSAPDLPAGGPPERYDP